MKYLSLSKRGLSTSVSLIILLIVVMAILIPFVFYLEYSSSYSQVNSAISNNYVTLKTNQYKNVVDGKPSILYSNSSLVFQFINGTFSSPTSFTIKKVLFFNPSTGYWKEVEKACVSFQNGTKEDIDLEGLTVNAGVQIQFSKNLVTDPIAIVTTLGNIFYLTPDSSIGPYSSIGKGGFTIVSQAVSKQGLTGISTEVVSNIKGAYATYKTPVSFSNQTGSFYVNEPEEYVYFTNASGIYTAQFYNWYVIGNALLTKINSTEVKVTLEGSQAVLVSNYSVVTAKVTLNIVNNYYSDTGSVKVKLDGATEQVGSSSSFQVTAGYVNLTAITTTVCDLKDNGQERSYFNFSNFTYDGVIYKGTEALLLIPPTISSATVYLNYFNGVNCFNITIEMEEYNGDGYPNNVTHIIPKGAPCPETAYFNGTGEDLKLDSPVSFWIKQGNYSIGGTGTIESNGYCVYYTDSSPQCFPIIDWGPYVINTSTGQQITNGYYYIESPVTIYFYYAFDEGFNPLE